MLAKLNPTQPTSTRTAKVMVGTSSFSPSIGNVLLRDEADPRPVAVMMCGLCGSGKSTMSHAIVAENPQFVRLSIDGIVHEMHGVYGVDYLESKCAEYQDEAADVFEQRLWGRLHSGGDVVLDRSFHSKEDRDYFRQLIERHGGRVVLLYMREPAKVKLWARIQERKRQKHTLHGERLGDAAVETSRATFDAYWDGFERPAGEGEIVMTNSINNQEAG